MGDNITILAGQLKALMSQGWSVKERLQQAEARVKAFPFDAKAQVEAEQLGLLDVQLYIRFMGLLTQYTQLYDKNYGPVLRGT
mgnify:FL=1